MTLTKTALLALKGTGIEGKQRIAEATGSTVSTVHRWIKNNHEYLTMASVLLVVEELTGIPMNELTEAKVQPVAA